MEALNAIDNYFTRAGDELSGEPFGSPPPSGFRPSPRAAPGVSRRPAAVGDNHGDETASDTSVDSDSDSSVDLDEQTPPRVRPANNKAAAPAVLAPDPAEPPAPTMSPALPAPPAPNLREAAKVMVRQRGLRTRLACFF